MRVVGVMAVMKPPEAGAKFVAPPIVTVAQPPPVPRRPVVASLVAVSLVALLVMELQ